MHTKVQISSDHSKVLHSTQVLLHKVKVIMSRIYCAKNLHMRADPRCFRHWGRETIPKTRAWVLRFAVTETTLLDGSCIFHHIVLLLRLVQQRFVLPARVKTELIPVRCWAL